MWEDAVHACLVWYCFNAVTGRHVFALLHKTILTSQTLAYLGAARRWVMPLKFSMSNKLLKSGLQITLGRPDKLSLSEDMLYYS